MARSVNNVPRSRARELERLAHSKGYTVVAMALGSKHITVQLHDPNTSRQLTAFCSLTPSDARSDLNAFSRNRLLQPARRGSEA